MRRIVRMPWLGGALLCVAGLTGCSHTQSQPVAQLPARRPAMLTPAGSIQQVVYNEVDEDNSMPTDYSDIQWQYQAGESQDEMASVPMMDTANVQEEFVQGETVQGE